MIMILTHVLILIGFVHKKIHFQQNIFQLYTGWYWRLLDVTEYPETVYSRWFRGFELLLLI